MKAINQGQIPGRLLLNQTFPKCRCVSSAVLKCFIAVCLVGQIVSGEEHSTPVNPHLQTNSSSKDIHKEDGVVSSHKNELSSSASSNIVSSSVPLVSSSSLNSQGELTGFGDKFPSSWGFEHKLGHFDDSYDHNAHQEASSSSHSMFSSTEDLYPEEVSLDHYTGNSSLSSSEGAGADKRRGILTKTADGRPFIPIFTKHTKIYPTQASSYSAHGHHHGWKSGSGKGKRFKRRPRRKKCRRCRRGHRRPHRRPRGGWGPPKGFHSHSPAHFDEDRKPASSSIFKNPFSFLARKRKRPPPHRRNKPRGYPDTHEDYGDYGDEDDKPFVIKNKLNLNLNLVRGEGEEGDEENEEGGDEGHPDNHEEHNGGGFGNHGGHPPKEFGPFKGGNPIVIGGNGDGNHNPSSHHDSPPHHHVESKPSSHPKKHGKSKDPFWNVQIPNFGFGNPFKGGFGGNKDDSSREHFESNRGKSRFPTSISDIMDSDREKDSHHHHGPPPHNGGPPGPPRGPPPPPNHHPEDGPPPGFFDGPPHSHEDGPPPPPPHHHPYDDGPFDGPPDGPPPPPHPHGPPPPPQHESEYHGEPRPLHPGKKRPSHFEYSTGGKRPAPGMHHYKRPSGGKHGRRRPPSHTPMSYSEEERFYENEDRPPRPRRPPHSKRKPSWFSHGKPPHHDDGPDHASPDHIRNAPSPDDYYHPRRPLADGPPKSKQLGYYGFPHKPPSHHGPPNFHGPPEHHNGPHEYHHNGPPDYTEHYHGPPDHHGHSDFHSGGPPKHNNHIEHEEDEPVFLPPYSDNHNNGLPHTSHELHLTHTPPHHHQSINSHPPPTASKLRSPHSSPHPYMEASPDPHDNDPPFFYEHSEVINGSPQPHLHQEDNHSPQLPHHHHSGLNEGGPSREPPHLHSTGRPPRPQRPPRPPPSQLPHFDQVLNHEGNQGNYHGHSDFDDHPHHHAPRVPSSHAPPPPPTHFSKPQPPRSPKPPSFFSSPHFVPNGPPSHFEHSPILMPSPGPPPPPRRPLFLQPKPVSYSNFVHEHPADRPHHHQKPPRPFKRRPKNRHHPNIQHQSYPDSIQGIINQPPPPPQQQQPSYPSSPPRRPLLEGPKPTAQYHPPSSGSPENAEVVYGKPMHTLHGGDSLAYRPKGALLASSLPFKSFPSFSQAQKYAAQHSSSHNYQGYRSHYSKPKQPQPIKYGTYEHPHGASLQESLTPTALYGSMKQVVSKFNPFGFSGNHSSSTSQSQQKPSFSGGYNKFGKYGKKIQQGKKNPYKLLSNTMYHQPMAGLVVKPMKPRPASYADSLVHNINSPKSGPNQKHVEFKGKAPKYSTLPEKWEHFDPDPTHSTLPKLTYDANGNQNPVSQHPNPKAIKNSQMRLKKRNPFDGRAMTKFTAADAVAKPINLQKRNGVEGDVKDADQDEYEDVSSSVSSEGKDETKPAPAM